MTAIETPAPDEYLATHRLPALAVACPTCHSAPGQLCTSHGGTRTRHHDVHQPRTRAWRIQTT